MSSANPSNRSLDLAEAFARARRLTSSPTLYVGATTVVLSHEAVEWLQLSDFHTSLALFPVALVLLYLQLTLVALFERRRGARRCGPRQ